MYLINIILILWYSRLNTDFHCLIFWHLWIMMPSIMHTFDLWWIVIPDWCYSYKSTLILQGLIQTGGFNNIIVQGWNLYFAFSLGYIYNICTFVVFFSHNSICIKSNYNNTLCCLNVMYCNCLCIVKKGK